ncbi:hypothetical protein MMC26_004886 [Xylographa opegraphella]|nr:hypothetical protein [Xylographa opegraphella]
MKNQHIFVLSAILALSHRVLATPWLGPDPTPTGLMAQIGISLRPTEAPGLNGIPKELLVRQGEVPFPPPNNCYNSDTPWCGTYNFDSGTRLYDCQSLPDQTFTVEFLADYYASRGQTLADTAGPVTITAPTETLPTLMTVMATVTVSAAASGTTDTAQSSAQSSAHSTPGASASQSSPSPETTSASPTPSTVATSQSGLSMGAIIGIAVGGGGAVLLLIAGLVAFCCIKRRNRTRRPRGQPLPVEHHFPPIEKPRASGPYASVPQQDQGLTETSTYGGGKAFDAPPPFSSVNRTPIGSEQSPVKTRFSAATVSSQSTHSPYAQHPSISEVDGDIYKGAPLHHVDEVEAVSPPLNGDGQRSHELDHNERQYQAHDGIYEMGVEGVGMGPRFNGPHELEHGRYG